MERERVTKKKRLTGLRRVNSVTSVSYRAAIIERESGTIASGKFEMKSFSVSITNENGVHEHVRNGEKFRGSQKDCPLCANGSVFEKSFGSIGA
jgi:hypothetical protein